MLAGRPATTPGVTRGSTMPWPTSRPTLLASSVAWLVPMLRITKNVATPIRATAARPDSANLVTAYFSS